MPHTITQIKPHDGPNVCCRIFSCRSRLHNLTHSAIVDEAMEDAATATPTQWMKVFCHRLTPAHAPGKRWTAGN
jgi:hypothetical protein